VVDVRLVLQLFKGSATVRGRLEVVNQAHDHRMRVRLPLGLDGADLLTGTQFGAVHRAAPRPAAVANAIEAPVSTVPVHRFAAAAMGARGLAFLAPGFFEGEWQGGDLLVTLLRATGELSRSDLATRPGHAAWPVPVPAAQCRGPSHLMFALAPVDEALLASGHGVPVLWEDAFVPLQATWLRDATELTPPGDAVELEGHGLVLSLVKPADDGLGTIIRLYSTRPSAVSAELRFGTPRIEAHRMRADERDTTPLPLTDGGRTLRFPVGPLAIATVRVR
jgi:alpha-mannosidase